MPFPTLTLGHQSLPRRSFYDFFSQWAAIHDGPYFGEYGSDVYDSRINATNEAMQATIVEDLTQEIYDNASNLGLGVSIGGFVFEFNDEWWKYQDGGWYVHDTAPSWSNGGYPDPEIKKNGGALLISIGTARGVLPTSRLRDARIAPILSRW